MVKSGMKPSKRADISPFLVMDLLDKANALQAEGRDILHLEAGQPGTPAPLSVRRTAKSAIDSDLIGYTEALGMPSLRQRISRYYQTTYGVEVAPGRIVVTTGSSAGFVLAFLSVFDTGARVAMGAPYYPAYPNILKALGYDPVILDTGPETAFQITPGLLESAGSGYDGVVVASPANPTGSMVAPEQLKALTSYCSDRNIICLSDEIYHGITYGERAHSALEYSDDVIVINSFSKYFSMTGWRIGWLVVPESLIRPIERLSQNFYISVPAVSQIAATSAFDEISELDSHVDGYRRNRDLLISALPQLGLTDIAPPDGAFYLYADISHITQDSLAFCQEMLVDIGVASTPGADFDRGTRSAKVRFSYAGAHSDIQKALERLADWLPNR